MTHSWDNVYEIDARPSTLFNPQYIDNGEDPDNADFKYLAGYRKFWTQVIYCHVEDALGFFFSIPQPATSRHNKVPSLCEQYRIWDNKIEQGFKLPTNIWSRSCMDSRMWLESEMFDLSNELAGYHQDNVNATFDLVQQGIFWERRLINRSNFLKQDNP